MILLSIHAIVNFIVLYCMFFFPYVYSVKPPHLIAYSIICLAVQVVLLILGMTRKGHWVLSLYQSYRKPIPREIDYIKPLASEVIEQHNQVFGTKYSYSDFNFYVSDIQDPNAYAFSKHCIVFSSGLLTFGSDDEIKAVLAHEMGHIYYKDTQILMGMFWIEIPCRVFIRIFDVWWRMTAPMVSEKAGILIFAGVVSIVFWIFLLPVYFLSILSRVLFGLILMLTAKRTEYRADYHAYRLGYGEYLMSFLDKIAHTVAHDNRFFTDLVASHPAPLQRLGKLDGYFRYGTEKVSYDKQKPVDKFLPTLLLVVFMGCGLIYSVNYLDDLDKARRAKAQKPKAHVAAVKKTKSKKNKQIIK